MFSFEFLRYRAVVLELWSWPSRGSASWCLPMYYKSEGNNIVLNIFNILQNIFISNNGIRNILDSKFYTGVYAAYIVETRSFVSLNYGGNEYIVTVIKNSVNKREGLTHFK
jgi:hypothetical protein